MAGLTDPGLIAVVRAAHPAQVGPIAEALLAGGVSAIEITMTTPQAIAAIREASRALGDRALLGVGTVLDGATAKAAIEAGAEFVVSPIHKTEIAAAAHAADRPVMLGAYTPSECQAAYEMGADFIKVFPADGLGPSYIKAIRTVLPHLRIVPTGGVDLETAASFLQAGCAALGVGSALVSSKILAAGDWAEITRLAAEFIKIARAVRTRRDERPDAVALTSRANQ